jgi:ribosomal protein L37AE/L43A
MDANDCPDKAKHTPCPRGYIEWHDWAETMSKTHKQHQCPTCKRWSIWKRK